MNVPKSCVEVFNRKNHPATVMFIVKKRDGKYSLAWKTIVARSRRTFSYAGGIRFLEVLGDAGPGTKHVFVKQHRNALNMARNLVKEMDR